MWYFVRRHRAVTATGCVGLVLLAAALGFLARSWWENRRGLALNAFEGGQKCYAEGRVTEGYNRMRRAIDLLPIGESYLRGYFRRNVASLKASLSHEEFRHEFPGAVHAAVASPDGRYVLAGDAAGTMTLWDLARDTTVELPGRADRQRVTAVAFDRTGTRCAAAVYGGDVTVWHVPSRTDYWHV